MQTVGTQTFVHLIEDFIFQWHQKNKGREGQAKRVAQDEEEQKKRLIMAEVEDAAERETKRSSSPRVVSIQEVQAVAAKDGVGSPTFADIREGTGLNEADIVFAMKSAQARLVHWPSSEEPHRTRYCLREHAEANGLENWQPGVGF